MVRKKKIIVIFILFCIITIFGVFNNTPLAKWISYLSLPVSTFGHFLFFTYIKQIPKSIKNWYLIGLLIMIVSISTSYIHYNQSFIDSFVATKNFYQVGVVFLIYFLIIKYKLSMKELFDSIIFLGWLTLLLVFFLMSIDYSITFTNIDGKVIFSTIGKFNKSLIFFSAIYYLAMFLIKGKYKFLIFMILFFSIPHLNEIQRVIFLSSIITVIVGFRLVNSNRVKVKIFLPVLLVLFGFINFLSFTAEGKDFIYRFEQMAKFINFDEDTAIDDSSVAVRLIENEFALNKFSEHPLTGNGFYRRSNHANVVGDIYFHFLDIGIVGILYTLGIFGAIIFIYQYVLLYKIIQNNKYYNVYGLASVLGLLFIMLFSLSAGTSINSFSYFFFFVILLKLSTKKYEVVN